MSEKGKKKFNDKKKFLSDLEIAIDGLTYMSETDAPFSVVDTELELPDFIDALRVGANDLIEQRTATEFLDRLTAIKEWFTPERVAAAGRYAELRRLIEASLTDLRLIRVGSIKVDIYLVGTDRNGMVAGIKTLAVET